MITTSSSKFEVHRVAPLEWSVSTTWIASCGANRIVLLLLSSPILNQFRGVGFCFEVHTWNAFFVTDSRSSCFVNTSGTSFVVRTLSLLGRPCSTACHTHRCLWCGNTSACARWMTSALPSDAHTAIPLHALKYTVCDLDLPVMINVVDSHHE